MDTFNACTSDQTPTVVISHRSSIEYLDLHRELLIPPVSKAAVTGPDDSGAVVLADFGRPPQAVVPADVKATSHQRAADVQLDRLTRPVNILVRDTPGLRKTHNLTPHSWKNPIDLNLLVQTLEKDNYYLCCPELALAQAGAHMDMLERMELALQLTGTYRRITTAQAPLYEEIYGARAMDFYPRESDSSTCERATVYGLEPLTNIALINKYIHLDCTKGCYGTDRLRSILPYLCDGLASPLESEWYIRSCLPRGIGSAGLSKPLINIKLELNDKAKKIAKKDYIIPDFYWPDGHIVVEINGGRDHNSPDGIVDISRRDKAYRAMGIDCLTLTSNELHDPYAFAATVRSVQQSLGITPDRSDPDFSTKARMLASEVREILSR